MNRRLLPLAFSAALVAASTSDAEPQSPLIKLNLPPDGAVIPYNADSVTFSFTADWAKLNEKYARFGGLANCEMMIELRLKKAPGAPQGLQSFLKPGQSQKTWKAQEINQAFPGALLTDDPLLWRVVIWPKSAPKSDANTDAASASFHWGPKPKEINPNANPGVRVPSPPRR